MSTTMKNDPALVSSPPIPAVLVAHTHWDREWYLSVEQLRPRLLRLFEHLQAIIETEPGYRCFWLDGQIIPLVDYWETVGEKPAWLEAALRRGQILIGPWYTLVDEWLTSGEAIIRNLFAGRRVMQAYGQDNRVGYLPDSFGHISQMPAILTGFDIDNAFLFRGIGPEPLPSVEFEWDAPGGTQVRGIHLAEGYFNAQRIDADRHLVDAGIPRATQPIRNLAQRSASGVLLLLNGVDQSLPTHRLDRSIAVLGSLLPELAIKQGSPVDYLALLESHWPAPGQLPVISGELLHAPQLDATLSARVEQKIANRVAENILTFSVEPLMTLVPPERRLQYRGMLRRAWTLLMECHAHDSICSCHSDLVAADVMSRLNQARQLAETLEQELWPAILGMRPNEQATSLPSTLVLWQPLPWDQDQPVEVVIDVPAGADVDKLVFEQAGQPIPAHIVDRRGICRWTEHYYGKVENKEVGTQRLTALIQPHLPGGSLTGIHVRLATDASESGVRDTIGDTSSPSPGTPGEGGVRASTSTGEMPSPNPLPEYRERASEAPDTLDNGLIHVRIHPNGSLDITDVASGQRFEGLNQIVDEVDRGDLYEHARTLDKSVRRPSPGKMTAIESSALRAIVQVTTEIECNGTMCPLELQISLCAGSRAVHVRAILDNRARDHWLRSVFPIPAQLRDLQVHTPFDLVRRKLDDGAPYVEGDRIRYARRLGQPMQWGLIALTDQGLLGLFNRGLYEYIHEDAQHISLSLMRFVGLIRPDLTSYPATAANRPGVQSAEYAIGLWPTGDMAATLRAMAQYNLPTRGVQLFTPQPRLPNVHLRWSNPYWMLSALKPAEAGEGTVLRLWNASETNQEGVIEYSGGLNGAMLARVDETPLKPLPPRLVTGPKEIVTILLPKAGAV
jgi:mannosylglycerate hydrolase